MGTRADRIFQILKEAGPRLAVSEIAERLAKMEKVDGLSSSFVSATVAIDNKSRGKAGQAPRFNVYGDRTEEFGFVSLRRASGKVDHRDADSLRTQIPEAIQEANKGPRQELKKAISQLTWQEFETEFLSQVLEALGLHEVEITQPTHDGGMDATCKYKRGIVQSQAIVSAKHWQSATVPVSEVQRLRGIKGPADTAIIVTSSRFTQAAKNEAAPSQNQRSVVLVDGDLILDACLASGLGVEEVKLPPLFRFVGFSKEPVEKMNDVGSQNK